VGVKYRRAPRSGHSDERLQRRPRRERSFPTDMEEIHKTLGGEQTRIDVWHGAWTLGA
jgi:hypothetical protein